MTKMAALSGGSVDGPFFGRPAKLEISSRANPALEMAFHLGPGRALAASYRITLDVADRTVFALGSGAVGGAAPRSEARYVAKALKLSKNTTDRVFPSWLFMGAFESSSSTTCVNPRKCLKARSMPANQESRCSSVGVRT
jgi:hypothetical protein